MHTDELLSLFFLFSSLMALLKKETAAEERKRSFYLQLDEREAENDLCSDAEFLLVEFR